MGQDPEPVRPPLPSHRLSHARHPDVTFAGQDLFRLGKRFIHAKLRIFYPTRDDSSFIIRDGYNDR